MKSTFTFLMVSLLVLLSCNDTPTPTETSQTVETDQVRIKGTVLNYNILDSIKTIKFYVEHPTEGQQEFALPIISDGTFKGSFPTYRQQSIGIIYKTWTYIIAEGGDDITLEIDGQLKEGKSVYKTMSLKGTSQKENQELFKYLQNDPFDNDVYFGAYQNLESEGFKKTHDSIFELKKTYADDFLMSTSLSPSVRNYIIFDRDFSSKIQLLGYYLFNPKARNSNYENILPEDFLNEAATVPEVTTDMLVNSNLISSFSNRYMFYLFDKIRKVNQGAQPSEQGDLQFQGLIEYTKANPMLQQLVLNERLKAGFENNDLKEYQKHQREYDSIFKNSFAAKAHQAKILEIEELLANPVLPKNSQLLEFASTSPTDYLDEIIKNADGKVVFIDNWATWCGPCRQEFKSSTPELKKKFGNDVEFVYLCYQSEKEAWQPMISKYKIEGKHYFVNKKDERPLFKQVNLQGFPTYTIIDKKGEIAKSSFEYRPSNPVTTEILTQLVSE